MNAGTIRESPASPDVATQCTARPRHTEVPAFYGAAQRYLQERGISTEDFFQAGCEVSENARALDPIYPPGPALVFRFHDPLTGEPQTFSEPQGTPRPFHRVRPLVARGAKFLQPRSSGTHVFFARHRNIDWPEVLSDTSYALVLTEGETRSLAGVAHGLPVVSVTGVDCGQIDGQLHPDLARVELRGRQIFLAFDSDVSRKRGPALAIERLAGLLRQRGANVFQALIPAAPDGSKQGLDDFLARHGKQAFEALIRSPETITVAGTDAYEPPVGLVNLMAAEYPATEWVWDNFILKNEVNLLFGDGGVGKSLLALYVAVAVAAGCKALGSGTTTMPVLGLFAEDSAAQIQQRITSILINFGLPSKGDLPIRLWCQPRGDTTLAQIDDAGVVKELPRLTALRTELENIGAPALVVLDSLADLFALNESLRLPVNAALKQILGGLCRDFGATVLVLAHPSKTSMLDGSNYSGSTAFNNAVRQRLTLEVAKRKEGEFAEGPPPRILSVAKSNYGAQGEKMFWVYGTDIEEAPRPVADDGRRLTFRTAVVDAAKTAAVLNMPCNRKVINDQVYEAAKKVLGRRPSAKEIQRELQAAVASGALLFLGPSSKRGAGYYPPDHEEAIALAIAARKAQARPTTSSNAGA